MSMEETENNLVELVEHACSEDDILIRAVSKYIGVGPAYLDDALRMHKIDPKAKADSVDRDQVALAIGYIFTRIASPDPVAYSENGTYVDYSAYPLDKYNSLQKERFASMNELLDEFNKNERVEEDTESNRKVAEMDSSVSKQRQLAQRFAEEEKEYAEIGRNVLENMNAINALIDEIKRKKKPTVEELNASSVVKVTGIDLLCICLKLFNIFIPCAYVRKEQALCLRLLRNSCGFRGSGMLPLNRKLLLRISKR